jgi:hypothetical protein
MSLRMYIAASVLEPLFGLMNKNRGRVGDSWNCVREIPSHAIHLIGVRLRPDKS